MVQKQSSRGSGPCGPRLWLALLSLLVRGSPGQEGGHLLNVPFLFGSDCSQSPQSFQVNSGRMEPTRCNVPSQGQQDLGSHPSEQQEAAAQYSCPGQANLGRFPKIPI